MSTQCAEASHAPSQLFLGGMLIHGQGAPPDYMRALMWLQRASESDDDVSQVALQAYNELKENIDSANSYTSKKQRHYVKDL